MVDAGDFFTFSNPLFSDAFVALVLYIVYRLLAKRLPRVAEGIKEASLLFLVFMCYDASRYFALDEESTAIANARRVIAFEKETHINIEIPIQKLVVKHESFAKFLNSFYLAAHWGGLVIFFVWAYARVLFAPASKAERRRTEYVTARGRFIIMNMLAAFSFMTFPCAPPRSVTGAGYVDTLLSISHADVYTKTRRFVNPYAAMPSMHQGYSLLFALTIALMLRSEIIHMKTETNEDDGEVGLLSSAPTTRLGKAKATVSDLLRKYQRYHLLSSETRGNEKKLFILSFLPFVVLAYPVFMFVVIVGTGNHFVLDALAGAGAFGLAALLFPIVARAITWVEVNIIRKGTTWAHTSLTHLSRQILGQTSDIEMGGMLDEKSYEKLEKNEKSDKFVQQYPLAETA